MLSTGPVGYGAKMIEAVRPRAPRVVALIGNNNLQNRLLARLIDAHIECSCLLRSAEELGEAPLDESAIALLDIDGLCPKAIADRVQLLTARASCSIGIINADECAALEHIVLWPGINGIFFRHASEEDLLKGIRAMFGGECWLSRRMLSARWQQTKPAYAETSDMAQLTPREIATVKLIASGKSNDQIARELNVSLHTVKTHVYNLFRKLNISNRVQAAHWASQHINAVAHE
jgi:DNA-binding NarL/FixJ family response regulator